MSRVRKASDELLYTIRSLVTVRARWLSNRVKPHLLERLSSYSCIQVRESRFRDEIKKKKKNFISSAIRSTVHACPRHINCNRRWKVAIGYQSTGTRRQVKTTERLVFVLILFPSEKSVRWDKRRQWQRQLKLNFSNSVIWFRLNSSISEKGSKLCGCWKQLRLCLKLGTVDSVHSVWNVNTKTKREETDVGTGIDYRVIGALWEMLDLRQRKRETCDRLFSIKPWTNKS